MFDKSFRKNAEAAGRGKFIKFDDQPTISVVLVGDAESGLVEYDGTDQRYFATPVGRFKMAVNAFDLESGTIRILQGPRGLADQLMEIEDKRPDLSKIVIEIRRTGSGYKTKYQAKAIRKLSDQEVEQLKACRPFDLAEALEWVPEARRMTAALQGSAGATNEPPPPGDDDISF